MDQQDAKNMAQWLQEILKMLQDTHTQLIDMRNENRQLMDDIKNISGRMDRKDSDILRLIETLKSQLDMTRAEVASSKTAIESVNSHIDSKVSDLKSSIHEVRNMVRASR